MPHFAFDSLILLLFNLKDFESQVLLVEHKEPKGGPLVDLLVHKKTKKHKLDKRARVHNHPDRRNIVLVGLAVFVVNVDLSDEEQQF